MAGERNEITNGGWQTTKVEREVVIDQGFVDWKKANQNLIEEIPSEMARLRMYEASLAVEKANIRAAHLRRVRAMSPELMNGSDASPEDSEQRGAYFDARRTSITEGMTVVSKRVQTVLSSDKSKEGKE